MANQSIRKVLLQSMIVISICIVVVVISGFLDRKGITTTFASFSPLADNSISSIPYPSPSSNVDTLQDPNASVMYPPPEDEPEQNKFQPNQPLFLKIVLWQCMIVVKSLISAK